MSCPFDSGRDANDSSPQDALSLNKPRFCSRPTNKEASVGAVRPQTAIPSASDSSTVLERVGGAEFSSQSCDITSMSVKWREACRGSLCVWMHSVSCIVLQLYASRTLIDPHPEESHRPEVPENQGMVPENQRMDLEDQGMVRDNQKTVPENQKMVPEAPRTRERSWRTRGNVPEKSGHQRIRVWSQRTNVCSQRTGRCFHMTRGRGGWYHGGPWVGTP